MVFIANFKSDDVVSGIYFCKTKTKALTKTGKEYLNINLQDKTGNIDGKIWTPSSPSIKEFDAGSFVKLNGEINVYNNAKQLIVTSIEVAKEGEYNTSDYFLTSKRNIEEMKKELDFYINSVEKKHYKELLNKVFGDKEFYDEFIKHTGAKLIHHSFVSGLLEHSLSVAKLCDSVCKNYDFLDRDLLITSALCHDVGKVYELGSGTSYDLTREGMLIGHVILSYEMLSKKIKEISDFPEKAMQDFLHCILSHHGQLEYGSPKNPLIYEATVLSSCDALDAKIEIMKEEFEKLSSKGGTFAYCKYIEGGYIVPTSREQ